MTEAIAIIGRACLLPGALTPETFWQNIIEKKNSLHLLTEKNWRLDNQSILKMQSAGTLSSTVGGCVDAFEKIFDPTGFTVSPECIQKQDVISKWLLHTSREALIDAGYSLPHAILSKTGAIMGSLNYPTNQFNEYAEHIWLLQQRPDIIGKKTYENLLKTKPDAISRFMSGYPMILLRKALGLGSTLFALDAACASSLYAIKYACDALHSRKADMMIAGGINAVDSLILNSGFTQLQALSRTGQSRPLHREADGLIPSQGIAIVILKRLEDAIKDKDNILGIIRGIGLTNDGLSKGFLVPSESGQVAAMKKAYQQANLQPQDVSWIECHATGTKLGDEIEIRSMLQLFHNPADVHLGALKAYIGHTITTSGAAALINVLSAFKNKIYPPTLLQTNETLEVLQNSSFQLNDSPKEWELSNDKSRIAAINCFGFGGNNSHLLVEEWSGNKKLQKTKLQPSAAAQDIAIVGIGAVVASANNYPTVAEAIFQGKNLLNQYNGNNWGGYTSSIELDIKKTRFAPADLVCALGQQLAVLKSTQEAIESVKNLDPEHTAVFIGTQCMTEAARPGLRWRLASWLPQYSEEHCELMKNHVYPEVQASHVIGIMPNIVTNRVNQLFNFQAPSCSIFADEISGMTALSLGIQALQNGEAENVIVGAVDLSCDLVHQTAMKEINSAHLPADAAVTLILKKLEDAKQHGDKIYAIVSPQEAPGTTSLELNANESKFVEQLGYAFAANDLLHVMIAASACYEKLSLNTEKNIAHQQETQSLRQIKVKATTHNTCSLEIFLREDVNF